MGRTPTRKSTKAVPSSPPAAVDWTGAEVQHAEYESGAQIFTQGDPATSVMYIAQGTVGCPCCRIPARRRLLPSWRTVTFSAKAASPASRSAWRPRRPWRTPTIVGRQERRDGAAPARAAGVLGPVPHAHADAEHPHRRGPDRSAVQLEREAAGAHAAAAGALRQAGKPRTARCRRCRRRRSPKWSARRGRA